MMLHLFRRPALTLQQTAHLQTAAAADVDWRIDRLETEYCYNVQLTRDLNEEERRRLMWLLAETYDAAGFSLASHFAPESSVIEVGPRMSFTTAWSTNAVSIFAVCGLDAIPRIERSRRFRFEALPPTEAQRRCLLGKIHDRMTECPYDKPLVTFETGIRPEPHAEPAW